MKSLSSTMRLKPISLCIFIRTGLPTKQDCLQEKSAVQISRIAYTDGKENCITLKEDVDFDLGAICSEITSNFCPQLILETVHVLIYRCIIVYSNPVK